MGLPGEPAGLALKRRPEEGCEAPFSRWRYRRRFVRRQRVDGQRMHLVRHQILNLIIHQAMPRNRSQALETSRYDVYPIVSGAACRTGMSGVQMRLVFDVQAGR